MAPRRHADQSEPSFSVVATSIPVGVRCHACGRLQLPGGLRRPPGDVSVGTATTLEVRCARCDATGTLLVDASNPGHQEVLHAIFGHYDDHKGTP